MLSDDPIRFGSALSMANAAVDGFADVHGATVEFLAVQGIDRILSFLRRAHRDEGKTLGATAHAIHHQVRFNNAAVRGKCVLKIVFSGVEGKIPNKQFIAHVMFYCPTNRCFPQTVPELRV